jgi:hypothetical protein
MAASWTELVPGPYPEAHLFVRCEGVDLLERTRDFDFAPFLEVTAHNSDRRDLDFEGKRHFMNASRFENFRSGRNCYTFFLITVARDSIEIAQNYDHRSGPEHARTMDLVRFLLQDRGAPWRWQAYSAYTDSGEGSDFATGDLRADLGG